MKSWPSITTVRLPPWLSARTRSRTRLVIDADDALVGDGHAVRVARQIVQHHLGSGQRCLGVDHPVVTLELLQAGSDAQHRCRPDRVAEGRPAGAPQGVEELAAEHLGQRMHREQEGRAALGPAPPAFAVQPAAGHQRVHVDVSAQVLRPGVQHQGEGGRGAQPAWVGGELGERGRGALHQGAVDPAGVELRQAVQRMRQREDEMTVRHRQQLGQLRLAPGVARAALALRAVPVAAGMEQPLLAPTLVALLHLAAQRRRATGDDGPPGTRLRRAQRVLAQVGRAEGAQHLGQGGAHARRGGLSAGAAAAVVSWATATARPARHRRRCSRGVPCAGSGWWC